MFTAGPRRSLEQFGPPSSPTPLRRRPRVVVILVLALLVLVALCLLPSGVRDPLLAAVAGAGGVAGVLICVRVSLDLRVVLAVRRC
ncbi:hypothetical protein [Streptomyces sp. NPDC007088]|uniref:hypothetical protein n=1 Tax=Streptomyces sp. NPDC007088 TaxID=3364773 RepID=UPI0036938B68